MNLLALMLAMTGTALLIGAGTPLWKGRRRIKSGDPELFLCEAPSPDDSLRCDQEIGHLGWHRCDAAEWYGDSWAVSEWDDTQEAPPIEQEPTLSAVEWAKQNLKTKQGTKMLPSAKPVKPTGIRTPSGILLSENAPTATSTAAPGEIDYFSMLNAPVRNRRKIVDRADMALIAKAMIFVIFGIGGGVMALHNLNNLQAGDGGLPAAPPPAQHQLLYRSGDPCPKSYKHQWACTLRGSKMVFMTDVYF